MKGAKMMRKLWITLTVATLVAAAWMPKSASATTFGVNYYPYLSGVDTMQFLCNRNWTTATKNKVNADLNMMRSMKLDCLRIIFFADGWVLPAACGGQAPYFSSDWSEIISNLPEFLGMCAARFMAVDIAFPSPYLLTQSHQAGVYDWAWAYCDTTTGWNNFMADTQKYITDIVTAVNNSGYATTVSWYDISNEIYTTPFYYKYPIYLQTIYDSGWVTASKIGFSVLRVPATGLTDYDNLKNGDSDSPWLGTARANATMLTDSHSYPETNSDGWLFDYKYSKAQTLYPNSTTIVGEYAWPYAIPSPSPGESPSSEALQRDNELTMMDDMIAAGFPHAMHWMWTGKCCGGSPPKLFEWFRNFDINQPNDIVGSVGTKLSSLTNGDMEQATGGVPTGWSYGSAGGHAVTGARVGPNTANAATNSYYFRLTSTFPGDTIYTLSPYTAIPVPCSSIYVNAYIRASVSNIQFSILQYDANNHLLSTTFGPTFTPPTWAMYSYQHQVGGWRCPASAGVKYVYVSVRGTVTSSPGYLDTDTVTLSAR
jgi:hypothetical protein